MYCDWCHTLVPSGNVLEVTFPKVKGTGYDDVGVFAYCLPCAKMLKETWAKAPDVKEPKWVVRVRGNGPDAQFVFGTPGNYFYGPGKPSKFSSYKEADGVAEGFTTLYGSNRTFTVEEAK